MHLCFTLLSDISSKTHYEEMYCCQTLLVFTFCPPSQWQNGLIRITVRASEWSLVSSGPKPTELRPGQLCYHQAHSDTQSRYNSRPHRVVQQKVTSVYIWVIEIKHLNTQIAQEGSKDLCTALRLPSWLVIHCTSKKINLPGRRRTTPFHDQAAVEDRKEPILHSLYLVWSLVTFDLTLPSL